MRWRVTLETYRQRRLLRLRRDSKRYSSGSFESEKSLIPLIGSASVSIGMKRGLASAESHENHIRTCAWGKLRADHMSMAGRSPLHHRSTGLPGLAVMDWQRESARTGTDRAIRILHYRPAPLPS